VNGSALMAHLPKGSIPEYPLCVQRSSARVPLAL
jgi:hypothetical protein